MTQSSGKKCQDILDDIIMNEEASKAKYNQRLKTQLKDVLNVRLVKSLSKDDTLKCHNHAPVMLYQKQECNYIKFTIAVDVLLMLAINSSISSLKSLFVRGIKDQLQGIVSCFDSFSEDSTFCIPKVFHFKTPNFPYITSCIYPWKQSNDQIFDENHFENERSRLLKKLLLPARRPTLHPNNAYIFQDDRAKDSSYLVNPHECLLKPAGNGSHVAVVDGYYSYHHYMQDGFDDNKWGCAYRSLQTIFSWFRYQGYTDKTVPGHRSIQEALVALGDKQPSFIGSKKWIGSFEVHLCLDYFLDVSSKILAVNSGAELQNKGRELIHHFQTQGTPVMIGGGVLAHTILGVSFNDRSGEIKFLILDPHYTGGEDLKIILDKGWCGWKNHMFWNQQAHYNLCMPQRPVKV
ncbi:ufm1-specific protease 2-like [Dendronephthya gigantea]|uniref:ufm1-specific protease 2-like n=1 Tax=Dendronephthya gigantea TaxID=151771 RepID=UPI00106C985C|nr:ufm1-specific protease 2-like [Dendronephthya gigantea]